jgi:hypothetical protein
MQLFLCRDDISNRKKSNRVESIGDDNAGSHFFHSNSHRGDIHKSMQNTTQARKQKQKQTHIFLLLNMSLNRYRSYPSSIDFVYIVTWMTLWLLHARRTHHVVLVNAEECNVAAEKNMFYNIG